MESRDNWLKILLDWLVKHLFEIAISIAIISMGIGFVLMIAKPSPFGRNLYNDCIEIVLRHGSIADAETMCADQKGK